MSEQPATGPLGQFLYDLSSIREKRNVSLEALRNATKVYPNVIAQFEVDGLKDHPLFNSLYVRAFIRSYANAVGIPPEDVLRAYDDALQGAYKRQLAIEYLDLPPEEIQALRASIKEKAAEPVFAVDKFEFEQQSQKVPAAKSKSATKNTTQRARPAKKKPRSQVNESDDGRAITFVPKSKQGPEESPLASLADGAKEAVSSFFASGKQNALVQWGLLAGGLTLFVIVVMQLLSFQADSPTLNDLQPAEPAATIPAESVSPIDATPDSLVTLPAQPIENTPARVPAVLGDSIAVQIVAATGPLDPFRVKRDTDLRRPYWLDQGDTMDVYLKNRAIIEDDLASMQILIDGYAYPIYRTDSLARVVISRDSIQAFLDSR